MRPQFAEKRLFVLGNTLANDGDTQSADGRRSILRHSGAQPVCISDCRRAEGVELVSGPQMRGKLLDELGWRINPVEALQILRQLDLHEGLKPLLQLLARECAEIGDFLVERAAD